VLEWSSWRRRWSLAKSPDPSSAPQCGTVDGIVGLTKIDEAGVVEFSGVTEDLAEGEKLGGVSTSVREWWFPSGESLSRRRRAYSFQELRGD
jgi:hypothetical protein